MYGKPYTDEESGSDKPDRQVVLETKPCRKCGSKLRPCKCIPSDSVVSNEVDSMRNSMRTNADNQ